jgi:phosphohistidine phosphatase
MNIYILRHGLAEETSASQKDADRRLTEEGERKLRHIARAMQAMELSFDLVVSSPYARARETAEIVARAFGLEKRLELSETLTPSGRTRQLVELLNRLAPPWEDVLLVGHEPYLSGLIALLVAGEEDRLSVTLKKGGLARISAATLVHGKCGDLEWLLTPRQMGLMK